MKTFKEYVNELPLPLRGIVKTIIWVVVFPFFLFGFLILSIAYFFDFISVQIFNIFGYNDYLKDWWEVKKHLFK